MHGVLVCSSLKIYLSRHASFNICMFMYMPVKLLGCAFVDSLLSWEVFWKWSSFTCRSIILLFCTYNIILIGIWYESDKRDDSIYQSRMVISSIFVFQIHLNKKSTCVTLDFPSPRQPCVFHKSFVILRNMCNNSLCQETILLLPSNSWDVLGWIKNLLDMSGYISLICSRWICQCFGPMHSTKDWNNELVIHYIEKCLRYASFTKTIDM